MNIRLMQSVEGDVHGFCNKALNADIAQMKATISNILISTCTASEEADVPGRVLFNKLSLCHDGPSVGSDASPMDARTKRLALKRTVVAAPSKKNCRPAKRLMIRSASGR